MILENTTADLHPASLARPSLTFLYHQLRPEKSAYTYALQCEEFAQQVDLFAESRRSGVALRPEITFDDGHMSDYEYALPVLVARSLVAQFFITVGWTGHKPGYMGWAEVRALAEAGQRVGAHGWTHTLLTHCTAAELHKELVSAREALEDKLGSAITSMSLPGGRYNRKVLSACRAAGYSEIYTSVPRAELPRPEIPRPQIPRPEAPVSEVPRSGIRGAEIPGDDVARPEVTRAEVAGAEVAGAEAPPPLRLIGRLNLRSGMSLQTIEQLLDPGSAALARLERYYHLKETAKSLLGDTLYAGIWARLNRQKAGAAAAVMTHP